MGKHYSALDEGLRAFLRAQPVFFVGSAPLEGDGHVNVSPKGMAGTFAILDDTRVAYLDYTGSGAETIAHLRQNGRIVLMFCAFVGPPRIVRLHGSGRVVVADDAEFAELRGYFPKERTIGQRSIIVVECHRIADSCGYSVPLMEYQGDRDILDRSHERREPEYFPEYWKRRNATSIDGIPAYPTTSGSDTETRMETS
ncbi:pyridoxamine 5'-phosphate oxidase family protein [Lipingzhangella sp. LS1_29]|uniref:Pyridoxamine 5'-phosphate oxidase family protein n=1 Tax=Lipingzhangella rawalii TaxID=2055835 RepID=A0ABU2H154_9ACTN|nr:pyridoxamine 5'-phosphate oxidase family protein [Lipingzhangella rawalii]MDS1269032.1 pyridoxamine 5'-phosphate oxidase family protein [Lipingzhangella rawalii]